jgi:hypothetical protein
MIARLTRWFLAHDPTTACAWEPAANDCCREWRKLADDLDAENDLLARRNHELDQENTRLHLELTEAQIDAGVVVPLPRLRAVEDLPVAVIERINEVDDWPARAGTAGGSDA